MKISLQQHIARSRQAVIANKAKGNRHAQFLAGMYASPGRFVEEVIQNAEDAYSRRGTMGEKKICFRLFNDRVEILHNGKDFDEADLMSVTTFASTTKKSSSEVNLIGKFGIGFKSVFSVCDSPQIHSGGYHYEILDYEVLEEISPLKITGFETVILLPFKKTDKQKIWQLVKESLLNLNENYLLFLKQINIIEVFDGNDLIRSISREVVDVNRTERRVNIFTREKNPGLFNESKASFQVFAKRPSGYRQELELAWKLREDDAGIKVCVVSQSEMFVYFPTKMNPGLSFILQGPFTTSPLRDHIPFDDRIAPENLALLKEATLLFEECMKRFRKSGMLTIEMLAMLPFSPPSKGTYPQANDIVYNAFREKATNMLKSECMIPCGKVYAKAADVVFPDDEDIALLLSNESIISLFQKKYSAGMRITDEALKPLKLFFTDIPGMKLADSRSLAFRISVNTDVLNHCSFDWFGNFFTFLSKHTELWDETNAGNYFSLRYKPIIPCNDGQLHPLFDNNDQPMVFLAGKSKKIKHAVHHRLLQTEGNASFFRLAGISAPDGFVSIMTDIIPSLELSDARKSPEGYFKNLRKIIHEFMNASLQRRQIMTEKLKNFRWIPAVNGFMEKALCCSAEVYLPSNSMKIFFKNKKDVFFAEKKFKDLVDSYGDDLAMSFYKESGIHLNPKKLPLEENAFPIEGLKEFFIYPPDIKASSALINILLNADADYTDASLISCLETKTWLYDEKNKLTSPVKLNNMSGKYHIKEDVQEKLRMLFQHGQPQDEVTKGMVFWKPETTPSLASLKPVCRIADLLNSAKKLQLQAIHTGLSVMNSFHVNNKISNTGLHLIGKDTILSVLQWCEEYLFRFLRDKYKAEIHKKSGDTYNYYIISENGEDHFIFFSGKTTLMNTYPIAAEAMSNIAALGQEANISLYLVTNAGDKFPEIITIGRVYEKFLNKNLLFSGYMELVIN